LIFPRYRGIFLTGQTRGTARAIFKEKLPCWSAAPGAYPDVLQEIKVTAEDTVPIERLRFAFVEDQPLMAVA
jgi:hypothetical protein